MILLVGCDKDSRQRDIRTATELARQIGIDDMTNVTLKRWDTVDHLHTDEDMALYLDACFAEDPGDGSLIRAALGDIARAGGMTPLARDTGMAREGLYKALSSEGHPEFTTI